MMETEGVRVILFPYIYPLASQSCVTISVFCVLPTTRVDFRASSWLLFQVSLILLTVSVLCSHTTARRRVCLYIVCALLTSYRTVVSLV
jgi:hypothetical protein